MKSVLLAGAMLAATYTAGTTTTAADTPNQTQQAVAWTEHFTLPQFLTTPRSAETVKDVRKMIADQWHHDFTVAPEAALVKPPVAPEETRSVSSCSDYFEGSGDRLRPVDPMNHTHAVFRIRAYMCIAAREIVTADAPDESHLDDPVLSERIPGALPAEVAMVISARERQRRVYNAPDGTSWADINSIQSATSMDTNRIRFEHVGGTQEITLVARGDFSGDGVEDVLIASRDWVEGGSYTTFRLFQLTRHGPGASYKLVREYDY